MIKTATKQLKNVFLATLMLLGTISLTQPGIIHAAASSSIGIVNYQLLVQQHPDMAQAEATYQAAVKQAQDDFNAKSANMNDQDKKALYQQLQQGLQQKRMELLGAINDKVDAAIKEVADAKGLTIVIDKSQVVYGGQDITDDVMKKITGK
ncbi:chaperone protein skp [Lucifera butyrica]|uniref:Chaperone protein skp n=1 Tax=Lucifera butyrica TaxID=1351585 RepID=A0A498RK06_9FIRM|nr:OmpH family outer membrane protein [Lucifera butyrica]VBB09368.1 chaperone protein skp [Lucifera butyrica]